MYRFGGAIKKQTRPTGLAQQQKKITFTLHPDIVSIIRNIASEEDIPMSVVADEAMYAGLKKLGRMD